jgi:hypothetical protein
MAANFDYSVNRRTASSELCSGQIDYVGIDMFGGLALRLLGLSFVFLDQVLVLRMQVGGLLCWEPLAALAAVSNLTGPGLITT